MSSVQAGWGDLLSGRNVAYTIAVAGGVALHAVNVFLATTILPSVVRDIGGLDYYAWNTTLFVAASILGSALSANLLQATGPRAAYGVAALLFALGTLICAIAPTMPVLLVGRFIQGFGGGFLYPLSYTVIRLVFPEALWPRAIGLVSAMWGIATLVGPAIGGMFAELGAWRAAFWSLLPVIALFAILAYSVLPRGEGEANEKPALPVAQLTLLMAAVLALSAGSVMQTAVWSVAGVGAAVVLIGLLVVVESLSGRRLLPKGALRLASPLGAVYATVALLVMGMQPEIFVPYFLQVLHGQSPFVAGYLAALIAAGWVVSSMVSAGWSDDASRRAIVTGPVLILVAVTTLAVFLPVKGEGSWAVLAPVCIGLALIGVGIGTAWPHLITRVFRVAPAGEQNLATSATTTVQLFATAFGAALAGMAANLAGLTMPGGEVGTISAARWLFGLFTIAPALCIVAALRVARERPADAEVQAALQPAE